ncbi:nucleoside hydrolase [Halocatena marina]|uniref:nucleoside hydrolase n=1 Tax=Halocatena marina TaxID=2934937 RepID=UPI00360E52E9
MRKKVHLDVDTGNDDAILLAMMLAAEDVDVVGVSTVCGNSTLTNTTQNTLSILELFDRTDVPVAKGAERPFVREHHDAEWVHGENGIRGDLPDPSTARSIRLRWSSSVSRWRLMVIASQSQLSAHSQISH